MAQTRSQLFLLRFSRRASVLIVVIGALVLTGWLLHVQVLKSTAPHLFAMNPVTAILFILCGVALLQATTKAKGKKSSRKVMVVCGTLILLGGGMKVAECVFDLDLNFDQLLFRKTALASGTHAPGEIAMNTAIGFICCGLSLLLLDVETRQGFRPAQVFILAVGLIALLALIGYAYRELPL